GHTAAWEVLRPTPSPWCLRNGARSRNRSWGRRRCTPRSRTGSTRSSAPPALLHLELGQVSRPAVAVRILSLGRRDSLYVPPREGGPPPSLACASVGRRAPPRVAATRR